MIAGIAAVGIGVYLAFAYSYDLWPFRLEVEQPPLPLGSEGKVSLGKGMPLEDLPQLILMPNSEIAKLARMQQNQFSLPIFCLSSGGEIFALAPTSDGGAAGWVWRDGAWTPGGYIGASWEGKPISREGVVSMIGSAAIEALPTERNDFEDFWRALCKDKNLGL